LRVLLAGISGFSFGHTHGHKYAIVLAFERVLMIIFETFA
jgi:hypothetical protein